MKVNYFPALVCGFIITLCCLMSAVPAYFTLTQLLVFNADFSGPSLGLDYKLLSLNGSVYPVLTYIQRNIPINKKILVFDQSNFSMYTSNSFVSFMDPLLVPLYRSDTKEQAYQILKGENIHYIYLPDTADPTFYNSCVAELVGDPNYSNLLYQSGFSRIYELKNQKMQEALQSIPIQNASLQITNNALPENWEVLSSSGKKISRNWKISQQGFEISNQSPFHQSETTYLVSGKGPLQAEPTNIFKESYLPNSPYLLKSTLHGWGYYRIFVVEYNEHGLQNTKEIWQGVLNKKSVQVSTQFLSGHDVRQFRLAFALIGPGKMGIRSLHLFRKETPKKPEENWKISTETSGIKNYYLSLRHRNYTQYLDSNLLAYNKDGQIVFTPLKPESKQSLVTPFIPYSKNNSFHFHFLVSGKGTLAIYYNIRNIFNENTTALLKTFSLNNRPLPVTVIIRSPEIPVSINNYPVKSIALSFQIVPFDGDPTLKISQFHWDQQKEKTYE